MITKLSLLFDNINSRVFGQVIKSKANIDLYNWVMEETTNLVNVTIKERVYYLLNNRPDPVCGYGKKKTFSIKKQEYGFCDNISNCACFLEHAKTVERLPIDVPNLLEKRKKTWISKYGVDNVAKVDSIKNKRLTTMATRNYESMYAKLAFDKQTVGYDQVISRVANSVSPEFSRDEYNGCFRKNKYTWKCVTCDNTFEDHIDYGRIPRCNKCYPKVVSTAENNIKEYIKSLGFTVISNTKEILKNLEYDIFIPDKMIAIEYNGVYWHSSIHKTKDYHVNKFIKSRDVGVHLVQIFEDEWINDPEIIRARLRSLLGVDSCIYARNCKIQNLSSIEYTSFTNTHHLQGTANATYKYGLFHSDILVAVMSFSKSRYSKSGYELIRYCSAGTVVGGAGKLFSHFCKEIDPDMIISYASRCWSNGKLYEKLGFSNVTIYDNNVGYWYIKDFIRYHRSTFTKGRLVKMGQDASLTEQEIMKNLGYLIVYDCGNYKFQWTK